MQGLFLGAKLTSLLSAIVFAFFYIDTYRGEVNPNEIVTVLEGVDRSTVGHFLIFNGRSHPLPIAIEAGGSDLFYRMKKGDEIKVVTDTNDFVASLYIYGRQVLTLQEYAEWKVGRANRWLKYSMFFFVTCMLFHFLGLRGKNNE